VNKTLLAVVAAFVLPTSSPTGTAGAWDRRQLPAITLDIFAPPDIRDSLVERARAETNAIWEPAGITFNWRRITSNPASARRRLEVTIDHARRGTSESHATLGWIRFTPDGPDSSIHLSVAAIEDLLLRTEGIGSLTNLNHERVMGRALGRALSHELGHYLLRSKAHTSRGLMRAEWPSAEYFAFSRGGFQLSPGERNAAARRLQHDSLTEGER
jgi:hypothetical protein